MMPAPLWLACITLATISQSLRCQDAPNPRTMNLNPLCVSVSLCLCLYFCVSVSVCLLLFCSLRSVADAASNQGPDSSAEVASLKREVASLKARGDSQSSALEQVRLELKQGYWRFEHPAFSDRRGLVLMHCQLAIRSSRFFFSDGCRCHWYTVSWRHKHFGILTSEGIALQTVNLRRQTFQHSDRGGGVDT